VLSVAWFPDRVRLAAGTSEGHVHVFSSVTGRELVRMTSSHQTRSGKPNVWAVEVVQPTSSGAAHLVAGDSSGRVTWFDGTLGTEVAGWSVHRADILSLAASRDGRAVLASGIDHQVALFRFVTEPSSIAGNVTTDINTNNTTGPPGMMISSSSSSVAAPLSKWVPVTSKRPHTHDVRAMVRIPSAEGPAHDLFASCSNDAHLVLYSVAHFEKQHPSRLSRVPDAPNITTTTIYDVVHDDDDHHHHDPDHDQHGLRPLRPQQRLVCQVPLSLSLSLSLS
jgi:U3 small nucleolar RNA-associated protein 4